MNYENVIELDCITVEDCIDLHHKKNITVEINDDRIINLVKE